MYHYTAAQWLLFFFFYCFAGWCIESAWVAAHEKRFVNRGFLRGAWIPIYGTGAIGMLFAGIPAGDNWFWLFASGFFFATLLEYATGICMERIFKIRYWDYSDKKWNLGGYVCLESSAAWGLLTIFLTQFLHPLTEKAVFLLPMDSAKVLASGLAVLFGIDLTLSVRAALDVTKALASLNAARIRAQDRALEWRESVEIRLDSWTERLQKSLLRNHPGARSSEYAEVLKILQKRLEERSGEKKKKKERGRKGK